MTRKWIVYALTLLGLAGAARADVFVAPIVAYERISEGGYSNNTEAGLAIGTTLPALPAHELSVEWTRLGWDFSKYPPANIIGGTTEWGNGHVDQFLACYHFRLPTPMPALHAYLEAGAGFARNAGSYRRDNVSAIVVNGNYSKWALEGKVGAGVEFAMLPHLSLRAGATYKMIGSSAANLYASSISGGGTSQQLIDHLSTGGFRMIGLAASVRFEF